MEMQLLTSTNSSKRVEGEFFGDGVPFLLALVLGVEVASDWMQDSTTRDSARSLVRPLPCHFPEPLES